MSEYYLQNDNYSCGPIAILNAVKWAGFDDFNDEEFLKDMRTITNCKPARNTGSGRERGGVTNANLYKGVTSRRELQVIDYIKDPSILDVRAAIDKKHGVILTHKNKYARTKGHAIFISSRLGNNYLVINEGIKMAIQPESFVSSKKLSKIMRASKKSKRFRSLAIFVRRNPYIF